MFKITADILTRAAGSSAFVVWTTHFPICAKHVAGSALVDSSCWAMCFFVSLGFPNAQSSGIDARPILFSTPDLSRSRRSNREERDLGRAEAAEGPHDGRREHVHYSWHGSGRSHEFSALQGHRQGCGEVGLVGGTVHDLSTSLNYSRSTARVSQWPRCDAYHTKLLLCSLGEGWRELPRHDLLSIGRKNRPRFAAQNKRATSSEWGESVSHTVPGGRVWSHSWEGGTTNHTKFFVGGTRGRMIQNETHCTSVPLHLCRP